MSKEDRMAAYKAAHLKANGKVAFILESRGWYTVGTYPSHLKCRAARVDEMTATLANRVALREWQSTQGIAARSDETQRGSAEGKSPVAKPCAPKEAA